ncbi:hypothetical protein EDD15DRAFT_2376782 [Pisolithus albus]|nr:hypothetical protein EDD15DRAFT_2376782 [Pisolithus albus]
MPRSKHTKKAAQCDPDGAGDTGVLSSSHEQTLRRTRRTTAGQGGVVTQLEKVGDILAQPQQTPRQRVALPEEGPSALSKGSKENTAREQPTEDLGGEVDVHTGLLPEFQRAEPGSRFGFQVRMPMQPSFVGTQSLNEYEQSRGRYEVHQIAQAAVPQAQRRTATSQPAATAWHTSQQPRQMVQRDSIVAEHISHLTSRSRPQTLSTVPEAPSTSSTPDPSMSRAPAAGTTADSGPSKKSAEKPSSKPSRAGQQVLRRAPNVSRINDGASDGLSELNSGKESHDPDEGAWSSPEDVAGEGAGGHADNDRMSENGPDENRLTFPSSDEDLNRSDFYLNAEEEMDAGPPHHLNDEFGLEDQMGTSPSRQQRMSPMTRTHSQQSSLQRQASQQHVHTDSTASSQHLPPRQSAPQHAASSQSGTRQPTFQQSQWPRLNAAPERTQDPLLSCPTGQVRNGPHLPDDERVGVDYDVNASHHSRNRRPRPPSPTYLENAGNGEKPHSKKQRCNVAGCTQDRLRSEDDGSGDNPTFVNERHGKYSKMAKADVVVRPTTLAFFGPLWCKLLDEAKRRVRLHVATEVPFLHREMAIDGICMEILVEMVIKYEEEGLELEAGYYPEHRRSMATILYNDTQTFRSEIKKAAVRIVPFEYCLYPPENIEDNAKRIEFVKKKATQLLEGARYLRGDVDSLGRASNFAHPALKKICLAVYYCASSKSLHQFIEFQTSVPDKALALVAAIVRSVLMTFKKHGAIKNESLCGEEVEDAYNNLTSLIDQVWHDSYHGNKLERMLREWARAGMTGYSARETARSETDEWQVVLD